MIKQRLQAVLAGMTHLSGRLWGWEISLRVGRGSAKVNQAGDESFVIGVMRAGVGVGWGVQF